MPTITVKNIPPELYELLKQSAEAHHRSINSEIIVCIERAVASRKLDPDTILAGARRLRGKTSDHPITSDEFSREKSAGRL